MKNRSHYNNPLITKLEVRYTSNAAVNGWGYQYYGSINQSDAGEYFTVCGYILA